ncbi:MAG: hypothetical protein ACLQNE_27470 [Thermoguttaceae bacterium]
MSHAILPALLTAILLSAEAAAQVQRRPEPGMLFIGEVNDGKFPDRLRVLANGPYGFARLAIRCPVRTHPNDSVPGVGMDRCRRSYRVDDYATYGLVRAPDRQKLDFWVGFRGDPNFDASGGNALFPERGHNYRLGNGDVFPIYDELYLATIHMETPGLWRTPSMELDRVTEKVPQGERPAAACRTIPLASACSRPAGLFFDIGTRMLRELAIPEMTQGQIEVREIWAAEGDKSLPRAVVVIRPPPPRGTLFAAPAGPSAGVSTGQPKEFQVTVSAGDMLATKRQAYKILKIVPPGPVDLGKLGRDWLVGWIEIDPKPIPPPAKVPEMAPVPPQAVPGLPKPGSK